MRTEISLSDLIYDLQNLKVIIDDMAEQAKIAAVDYSHIRATADSLATAIRHAANAADKQKFYSRVKNGMLYSEVFSKGGDLSEVDKAGIHNLGLF